MIEEELCAKMEVPAEEFQCPSSSSTSNSFKFVIKEEDELPNEEYQGSSSNSLKLEHNDQNLYNQIVYDSTDFYGNYYLPINNQTIFIQKFDNEESSETVYDEPNDPPYIYPDPNTAATTFPESSEVVYEEYTETIYDTEPFEILYNEASNLQGQLVLQSVAEDESSPFQYAINENGELVLQQLQEEVEEEQNVNDINQVFGKNLITGQMVTIPDHYLQTNLGDDLINKKISLGVLSNGKPLYGRILEIQRAEENIAVKVIREKKTVCSDYLELVQKNLCALVDMETVKEKLLEKPLVVKLVERRGTEVATLGRIRGFMEVSETTNTWTFIDFNSETDEEYLKNVKFKLRYVNPIHITLSIVRENDILRTTKVSFSPPSKSHTCILCHKEMKTLKSLNRHYNSSHDQTEDLTNETMFLCPTCNRLFKSASSLRRHQAIHNPELRGFECSVCKQRFTDNSTLKKHLLLHTGVKPHGCELCGRAFTNIGDLNSHRRTHLQQGRTRFTCQTCGRSFAKHNNMVRHSRIHRDGGFECHICGCNFKHSSSLTRHIVHAHVSSEAPKEES